ncbi:hypothetical protein ACWEBX_40015, partial [Streptomyces sp. NPDC005070]
MAAIHDTTMTPTKLELLTGWLPKQTWYVGDAEAPATIRGGRPPTPREGSAVSAESASRTGPS